MIPSFSTTTRDLPKKETLSLSSCLSATYDYHNTKHPVVLDYASGVSLPLTEDELETLANFIKRHYGFQCFYCPTCKSEIPDPKI